MTLHTMRFQMERAEHATILHSIVLHVKRMETDPSSVRLAKMVIISITLVLVVRPVLPLAQHAPQLLSVSHASTPHTTFTPTIVAFLVRLISRAG